MAEIMALLDTTTARIILMVWCLVIAVSVIFYSLYLKVARQNRFSNFGLQYSKKQRAQTILQNFNQLVGKFVSLSESSVLILHSGWDWRLVLRVLVWC